VRFADFGGNAPLIALYQNAQFLMLSSELATSRVEHAMFWTKIIRSLICCEISASYDWSGTFRLSAKGAIAVIILGLLAMTIWGGRM
jgi:hypothetical protein